MTTPTPMHPTVQQLMQERVNYLVQRDDLIAEIATKEELLALINRKLEECRQALRGAQMTVSASQQTANEEIA